MRRLGAFIPIVVLALLVQFMAPIAAFRAVASAVSDPIYMASICSEMTSSADDQTPPNKSGHDGNCCAFCASGSGGSPALEPPLPVFVNLQRQFQLVSWLEAADPMPALRVGSNRQARAPPQLA